MSIKEQILHELDRLSEVELAQVVRYLAFLKYQARVTSAPGPDERELAALYAEFGEEDRDMAEQGVANYARSLDKEDTQ